MVRESVKHGFSGMSIPTFDRISRFSNFSFFEEIRGFLKIYRRNSYFWNIINL